MHALEKQGRAEPVWLSKLLSLMVSMKLYDVVPVISVYVTQSLWDSENHGQPVARITSFLMLILNLSSVILCLAVGIAKVPYS